MTGQVVATHIHVRFAAVSLTRRRGRKSLLNRRDATLGISGSLRPGIFDQPGEGDFFNKLLSLAPFFFLPRFSLPCILNRKSLVLGPRSSEGV